MDSSNACGAAAASSSTFQCCIPPSKPIYCAAPHANSKCLNCNQNRKAECVGGTFVKFVFLFLFLLSPFNFSPSPPTQLFLSFAKVYLTSINEISGLCPGGANDDVQCCVLPQDDDNTRDKDLKNYDYHVSAAASASSDEGSGTPMDFGYDETAETDSAPRYVEQGNEVEET